MRRAIGVVLSALVLGAASMPAQVFGQAVEPVPLAASGDFGVDFIAEVVDPLPPEQSHVKGLGDIDGDGLSDAVVGSAQDGHGLFWYRAPTWERIRIAPDGIGFTTDLQLADVEGDGDLDIVVPHGFFQGDTVHWYENPGPLGDPGSDPWTDHLIGTAGAHDVEVGDLDADGDLDVVVRFGTTTAFMQTTPDEWERVVVSTRAREGLALGDLDRDGDLDIAINGSWLTNPGPDPLVGDPLVGDPLVGDPLVGDPFVGDPLVGDPFVGDPFVGDPLVGDPLVGDPLVGDPFVGDPLVGDPLVGDPLVGDPLVGDPLVGDPLVGDPLVGEWSEQPIAAVEAETTRIEIADIDGDGWNDVLIAPAEFSAGSLMWHRNPGGTGPWQPNTIAPAVRFQHTLQVGDFDGNGWLDVLTAEMHQSPAPEIVIHFQVRAGGQSPAVWRPVTIAGVGSHNMDIADVDGDGDLDFAGVNWDGSGQYLLFRNQLDPVGPIRLDQWARQEIAGIDRAAVFIDHSDLDGDGFQDIVAGAWWWQNPGSIAGAAWEQMTIGPGLTDYAAAHDFDDDGDIDLVGTAGSGFFGPSGAMRWAENDGTGNFVVHALPTLAGDFLQGALATRLRPEDPPVVVLAFDRGIGGVLAMTIPEGQVNVLHPVSDGEELSTGDIDGDGDLDLFTGRAWLRADDDGTYARVEVIPDTMVTPDRNRLSDIDGDGDLDAVIGSGDSGAGLLAWYEQGDDPTAVWAEHVLSNRAPARPQSLDVGDIDRDGDSDIVIGEHAFADLDQLTATILENPRLRSSEVDPVPRLRSSDVEPAWTEVDVFVGDEHHDGTQLVDLDNDGDLDLISTGFNDKTIRIHENLSG